MYGHYTVREKNQINDFPWHVFGEFAEDHKIKFLKKGSSI